MIARSIRTKGLLTLVSCRNLFTATTLMKRSGSNSGPNENEIDGPGPSSKKTSITKTTAGPGALPRPNKKPSVSSSSSSNSSYSLKIKAKKSSQTFLHKPNSTTMPPIGVDAKAEVQQIIANNALVVFSKTTCPFCTKAKDLLKTLSVKFETVELDTIDKGSSYQEALKELTGQSTVPNIFIHGKHLGGCDSLLTAHGNSSLADMIHNKADVVNFDYDLVVIGGGSGGLAAAKEAAQLGKKVALFDFVKPSPIGTTWGLGGTCVNVGCIPKKLMHRASILGEDLHDAREFGWEIPKKVSHSWETMKNAIQDHIGSINWGYRVQLRDKKVNYVNAYAEIVDKHTIKGTSYTPLRTQPSGEDDEATKKNKSEVTMTAGNIVLATGERPRYLDIPGAQEFTITSDDLFSLSYCPGKTLCVGASYVSLECAGFLAGIGLDTTVMVRSILLRGFDQQCAEIVGGYMEKHGVKFIRGAVPTKIEQLEEGEPGRYRVTAKSNDGSEIVEEYNTILVAVGRDPCTQGIGIENAQVKLHEKNNRVLVDAEERTNIPNIYAIGDIGEGRPELTPVAIQAGRLLARRMFQEGFSTTVDYTNIATTVFTPLEYGCIGYSEEAAIEKFGEDKIEVYHSYFMPLEWTVPHREENTCYAKLICNKQEKERVIGFHVVGPNAGEITQGYAVAMKKGATKEDFDSTIGIHPTCSETLTTLQVTKRSGASAEVTGC